MTGASPRIPVASATGVPAVVTAGDTRAAKAVYGESKVFLPVAGQPIVARLVATLQKVPEVSEVWVVGNLERLEDVFSDEVFRRGLRKPLHLVAQGRNLLENAWETYRRVISRDPAKGRDPGPSELDQQVLYVSGDLPFATAQEISAFVRSGLERPDCDYAFGYVHERALEGFLPSASGGTGIEVAYFNLRDGRVRQNNLHFARPGRIANRERINDMYEHRHQRQFWHMGALAWKVFFSRAGGPLIVSLYVAMHLAGLADRWKFRALADRLRDWVTLQRNEEVISRLLDARFRFLATEAGGCAIDVDTEQEYDAVQLNFEAWSQAQGERAEALYGPIAPADTAPAPMASGDAAER
ncbi:MAG: NTP transferase domain-containing protein [Myxococcota bacterium]|nr:NTP transferase domain-containing protein [Myxococcota bacterium]